jgi:hypothetical protein
MRKEVTNTTGQERNFRRGINEQMRRRKESNMLTSVNKQNPKMNKGEKKEQKVFESTMK